MATPSDYEKLSHGKTVDARKKASDYEKASYSRQKLISADTPPPKSEG